MQVTKVLAYYDANSININVYGELAKTIEEDNGYSMTFLQIHNYSSQKAVKNHRWNTDQHLVNKCRNNQQYY